MAYICPVKEMQDCSRWISLRCTLTLVLFLLTCQCVSSTTQAQAPDSTDTIRIDSDLVNLNISVLSKTPVQGVAPLQQKEFAVFENGAPQEISFFASAEAPFDLVLLLDLSGSTAKKIDLIRKSSKRFVEAARPGDRIAIVTFAAEVEVVSKFSLDHKALTRSINEIEKPEGGTNFWDALRFVLEHLVGQSRAENRRSAVVVMTDGVDNALPGVLGEGSTTRFDELIEILRHSDSTVLPIYLDTEKETVKNHQAPASAYVLAKQQLAQIAAESGSQVYQARKLKDLQNVYAQVMRDLGTVYSIGYRPANNIRDGLWRAVRVELIGHPDLAVRTRRGYYARLKAEE